ncbi:sensor histidine kinase [Haloglomus litoreum]|uniref:sensor histidine kinase n=1 Tax=Haloglomus litoreum TaxID=3034026 RepID=UPI0023E7B3C7|nr:ATP-binding protein [Haloglomus sp. DT116]
MGPSADSLLLVGILAGATVCWVGYRVSRTPAQPGRRWFIVFTAVLGGGCLITGTIAIVPSLLGRPSAQSLWAGWTNLPLLLWLLSTLPWFLFALQYTGTRTRLRRRTILLIGLPHLLFIGQIALNELYEFGSSSTLLYGLGSAAFIYITLLAAGGSYLLLQKSYAYEYLPLGQGAGLAVTMVGTLVIWNTVGMAPETATTTQAGAYAGGGGVAALALGAALLRYDLFEATPSVGTLGDRALTRETDDLMFVTDGDGRVVRINETAVDTLETARSDAIGSRLSEVLDHDRATLQRSETVAVQTTDGTRRYDPQVTAVRDHRDTRLGTMLSLRDVTDRELREQRLAVLNRVLRHNLRNETDVLKSHAEALEPVESDHVDAISDSADAIAALGQRANRIDRYVSESPDDVAVDLGDLVDTVLGTVGADRADVSVSTDTPASATLVTNRLALQSALESALDNAVAYAESAVDVVVEARPDGYAISVTDDGPGIPEWELDSLETGTESPLEHSTGLGLWQLKWAVMTLNGELSFETGDGTTVEFIVPDRADAATVRS